MPDIEELLSVLLKAHRRYGKEAYLELDVEDTGVYQEEWSPRLLLITPGPLDSEEGEE